MTVASIGLRASHTCAIVGLPYIVLAIVALIPPILAVTFLVGLFTIGEHLDAVVIQ